MKYREFIFSGEPSRKITAQEYPAFCLQFQKAVLASLEKRNLLTPPQYNRCVEEIEKQYNRESASYVDNEI